MDDNLTLNSASGTYTLNGTMGRRGKFGGVMTGHDATGRPVTVKALERYNEGLIKVLDRIRTLNRPDVAGIIDVFTGSDGRIYIVRELIEGTDLKTIFANKKVYGHIDENNYVKMGIAVLEASKPSTPSVSSTATSSRQTSSCATSPMPTSPSATSPTSPSSTSSKP